jgi:hypothetical protein
VILFRGAETHVRSVFKAISWRTLGTMDTFAIGWFMTGRVEIAGSIAGLEIITKLPGTIYTNGFGRPSHGAAADRERRALESAGMSQTGEKANHSLHSHAHFRLDEIVSRSPDYQV